MSIRPAYIDDPFAPAVKPPPPPRKPSRAAVTAKILLVALVVIGLAIATYFSAVGLVGLILAGAADWKIGLVGIGAVASTISFLGSIYFANKYRMFEDTGHNARDAKKFFLDSII